MEIAHTVQNGITVVAISGRLDPGTAPEAETHINAILDGGQTRLVFDFSGLDYLSSGGLRVILATAKKINRAGGALVLCDLQSYVKEIFEVSGFTALIPIEDSIESGLRKLADR